MPLSKTPHLQLLLSCSAAAAEDCVCSGQLPVWLRGAVWRWSRARLIKSIYMLLYNDERDTIKTHCLLISSPLIRRFYLSSPEWCAMGPGGRHPDTYQYVYPHLYTPHTDTVSHLFFLLVLHPGSVLDFLFSPFVSESEETSLSVSAFSLLCACRHTHTHTNTVRAQTHKHLHPQRQTHTQPAFCCCDGSELSKHPCFLSLSLTKAAWLSLSMQVHRDCCLSTLTLSFFLPPFFPLSLTFVYLSILISLSLSFTHVLLSFAYTGIYI